MNQILIKIKSIKKDIINKSTTKEVLKGISFEIFEGEIFSLLGRNGSGKTTLSNILASLHPPTSGEVEYKGQSIYQDVVSYRKVIGYCPQNPNLDLALTLEESLTFAGHYYQMSSKNIKNRVHEIMEQFHLIEYAKHKVHMLSGGYVRRFLIARSLIHFPKFLILDEPTVALDLVSKHEIENYISSLKENGTTVLLTTHDMVEAQRLSDRICILQEGVIKIIDTPHNLMKIYRKDQLEDIFLKVMKEKNL